jgi:hypothetical protein
MTFKEEGLVYDCVSFLHNTSKTNSNEELREMADAVALLLKTYKEHKFKTEKERVKNVRV